MREKLSATRCAKENKPGRYNDGGGLYLFVRKDGGKTWTFRWRDRVTGRLREKGLGVYGSRDVTLSDARDLAADCRRIVKAGGDPIKEARRNRQRAFLAANRDVTFNWCSKQYIDAHKASWKNAKHADQWRNTLDSYAKPILELPVATIETPDVLACLRPIWETKTETASRVRGRIESILGWATVSGYREGDNPARWKNHLDNLLPKRSKVQKVKHHTALPYAQIGDFVEDLRTKKGYAAAALEFQILAAARSGEVVGAEWNEMDLDAKTWTIPADRMKAEKEHVIPLSDRAVKILTGLPRRNEFVFPSMKADQHLSTAALLKLTKNWDSSLTAHGFRSTFRDWAGETTAYPREVIEHALAHQLKDKAEAAYQRGTLLTKRKRLMKDWASFCNKPSNSGTVTPIQKKSAEG